MTTYTVTVARKDKYGYHLAEGGKTFSGGAKREYAGEEAYEFEDSVGPAIYFRHELSEVTPEGAEQCVLESGTHDLGDNNSLIVFEGCYIFRFADKTMRMLTQDQWDRLGQIMREGGQ